ncbi:hypothetical protein BC832DRAFT_562912 [Gaertneriomyces semiglobifer]|nr:hypothetical protein BC832DRAFT_562912 [Gaertneriomyces semiglobifer]
MSLILSLVSWVLSNWVPVLLILVPLWYFKSFAHNPASAITTEVKKAHIAQEKKDSCCNGRAKEDTQQSGCCGGANAAEGGQQSGCCGGANTAEGSQCCSTTSTTQNEAAASQDNSKIGLKILYATQTRTSQALAKRLKEIVEREVPLIEEVLVQNIAEYENEDLNAERSPVVFFLSTFSEGTPTDDAAWFYQWLEDTRFDHRYDSTYMRKLRYAVFGLGDSVYEENYCAVAKRVDQYLHEMSGKRLCPLGLGDKSDDTEAQFLKWSTLFVSRLNGVANHLSISGEDADILDSEVPDYSSAEESDVDAAGQEEELVDVEDMGTVAAKMNESKAQRDGPAGLVVSRRRPTRETKEMVTPMLRKSLEKQGYKIVGTHSGVKLCRWTKSALRGRGSCYKHSLYGIDSHNCMEATPSLACANKCVFCWRQHTNPVGTEWRWKMDDPLTIVDGAMENHYKMIKQLKGVPGVIPSRFEEAFTIKHCALSLVGEPIMYPQINELVELLHARNISSFLVTNAQFPEAIENLKPVTQLYVSIDAGTKEDLKKIDRPLFRDFWERFLACLEGLSKKKQRTVYRLTLVKDKNDSTIDSYVSLVERGSPDFIEVKGVTYCGFSGASDLTMKNVPYHQEVLKFCYDLAAKLGDKYEVACAHEHSCTVLIADKTKYFIDGSWHTWIDYDKFFELVRADKPFTWADYRRKTPEWALVGDSRGGFKPEDTRWYRKGKGKKDADADANHEDVVAR